MTARMILQISLLPNVRFGLTGVGATRGWLWATGAFASYRNCKAGSGVGDRQTNLVVNGILVL